MRRLNKLLALPPEDQILLAGALFYVCLVRAALYVAPFETLKQALERLGKTGVSAASAQAHPADEAQRIARLVGWAARLVPQATCLTQALVTRLMLQRAGQDSTLRIGVMRDDKNIFRAHAWIEQRGQVIIGGNASSVARYVPLASLDALDPRWRKEADKN